MQALDERKTNGRWKVAYIDPQQVSELQQTFVMSDHLEKKSMNKQRHKRRKML
jgi:hypothetical protein